MIIPDAPNVRWGTDATSVLTGEGVATVFVAVDHFVADCVGIHAARPGTRFEAIEPIRQVLHEHFGGYRDDIGGASSFVTTTARGTSATGSRTNVRSSVSSRARRSCGSLKATVAPSASFARSKNSFSGSAGSIPSMSFVSRCSSSDGRTTRAGSSSATAFDRRRTFDLTTQHPRPHDDLRYFAYPGKPMRYTLHQIALKPIATRTTAAGRLVVNDPRSGIPSHRDSLTLLLDPRAHLAQCFLGHAALDARSPPR